MSLLSTAIFIQSLLGQYTPFCMKSFNCPYFLQGAIPQGAVAVTARSKAASKRTSSGTRKGKTETTGQT